MKKEAGGTQYSVERTKPFRILVADEERRHPKLAREDLEWLEGRLRLAPDKMGDHVPGLKGLNLPVYKTRLRDSCCDLAAREGWRVYYAVSGETMKVYMLFIHHKKELENPARNHLQQKMQRAFAEGV